MATTAPGELQNYHQLRRHHQQSHQSKHDSYNPYFDHHDFGASKHRFSENSSSPKEPIHLSSENKESSSILPLTSHNKKNSVNLEKKSCTQSLLPPIGDALLRRDHYNESAQQSSPGRNEEGNSFPDSKLLMKLSMKRTENNVNSTSSDDIQSRMSSDEKKSLFDVLGENPLSFPIKSESSNESLIQQISSQNYPLLPQSEDINSIIAMDGSLSGSIENFFRSNQHSASGSELSYVPGSHETPSYTTLTTLQHKSISSTVSEKCLLGGVSAYPPLMQKDFSTDSNLNKIGGMGHTLPPLSNQFILNSIAAKARDEIQTQETLDAVNQVATAVNLTNYNKTSILPPNIIPQPSAHMVSSAASYDDQVLRLNHHNSMSPVFQGTQIFSHRNRFSPPFSHTVHGMSNNLQNDCHDKRPSRIRQDDYNQDRRKTRASTERIANSTHSNFNQSARNQQIDEVNTKVVADQITAELKRSSIPQAVFARKVLSRSQGTLSDLLRNPKPWSKLKSGRETFRKMWKWLQEPSPFRVQQLRAEGKVLKFCFLIILTFCQSKKPKLHFMPFFNRIKKLL